MTDANSESLQRAIELSYRYLNDRERTVGEMRGHLARLGLGHEEIDGALQVLIGRGHLDDVRFARLFAQDKRELEDWGTDRISRALSRRGLDREIVEDALRPISSESEFERAVDLLRRRFPVPPSDRRERDRALGVLARKGYDSELALEALTAYARDADVPC